MSLLDVNNIAFTIFDYPMSWVELIGTLFGMLSVWLVVKRRIANYPVGIIGTGLFIFLFWQIGLYADAAENFLLMAMSGLGWYQWSKGKKADDDKVEIYRLSKTDTIKWVVGATVLSLLVGLWLNTAHIYYPAIFTQPASYPFVDAATTVFSFAAMVLMNRRYLENWSFWIAIDIVGIVLYWQKDVKLVAILYVVYLVLATMGLFQWVRKFLLDKGYGWW